MDLGITAVIISQEEKNLTVSYQVFPAFILFLISIHNVTKDSMRLSYLVDSWLILFNAFRLKLSAWESIIPASIRRHPKIPLAGNFSPKIKIPPIAANTDSILIAIAAWEALACFWATTCNV
jgi:hypothetical protein